MTFRARPVTRRPGRSGWDPGDRRTALINAGFIAAIAISLLILVGYAGWSWYDDHYGTAATVDGTVITKDELRTRYAIETFRIDYTGRRIQTDLAAGRISQNTASQQLAFLEQRRSSLPAISLERLIDTTLQARLASEAGIEVTDADIDAQLTAEATTDEQRHSWVIEVAPADDPATGEPGDDQKAAARQKAEAALAELEGGKKFEDVAMTTSSASSAAQGGDLGWLPKDSGQDPKLMDALFALSEPGITGVVEGDDAVYRIGRVTEIAPESVDQAFEAKLDEAKITLADYRSAVRGDVVRKKLSEKVVADLSKPGTQRHVLQIHLPTPTTQPQPDAVKVRHILFAPKDDPGAAQSLSTTDPSWEEAREEAQAAYEALVADPTKFDELARTGSDEASAKQTGGKQPWYDPSSPIDTAFAKAIFAEGLSPGDILEPFQSSFGWHVVQFMRPLGEGDEAWLRTIKQQADEGADFAQLARDQGEGVEAEDGGDIGWIAEGQFGDVKEGPIFDTPLNAVSDVAVVPSDGAYLFKSIAEEVREPTEEQLEIFEQNGFSDWYAQRKSEATITRNAATATGAG